MPIVLSPLPPLSSIVSPIVLTDTSDKKNLVVSAFPGDPLTGKAISLLNTHSQSFCLFFSMLFYLEFNQQDPHSADASALFFPFQNHFWKVVPKIRMKHFLLLLFTIFDYSCVWLSHSGSLCGRTCLFYPSKPSHQCALSKQLKLSKNR